MQDGAEEKLTRTKANTDSVPDNSEDRPEGVSAKEWAVMQLAAVIFNEDDEILSRALSKAVKSGSYDLTIEKYVEKRFLGLLNRYPDIRNEYNKNRKAERSQKVIAAREKLQQARKERRRQRNK